MSTEKAKDLDWIVYWRGDSPFAQWVTRNEANKLAADPSVKISSWIRA